MRLVRLDGLVDYRRDGGESEYIRHGGGRCCPEALSDLHNADPKQLQDGPRRTGDAHGVEQLVAENMDAHIL